MTSAERDQLLFFLRQVLQRPAAGKDTVADQLIKEACAQHPDALYLLVQRAMASHLALLAALDSNAALQSQLSQSLDPSKRLAPPTVGKPAHPAFPATSLWGSGVLGAIAGTAVGVVAGGWLFSDVDLMPDIIESASDAVTDDGLGLDGDDWA
jgi:hypothetical protein